MIRLLECLPFQLHQHSKSIPHSPVQFASRIHRCHWTEGPNQYRQAAGKKQMSAVHDHSGLVSTFIRTKESGKRKKR